MAKREPGIPITATPNEINPMGSTNLPKFTQYYRARTTVVKFGAKRAATIPAKTSLGGVVGDVGISAPMVLHARVCGRVGSCPIKQQKPRPARSRGPAWSY